MINKSLSEAFMEIDKNTEIDFKKAAGHILLRDIMISPVRKIGENEKFFLIEKKFREHEIKHLLVVDAKDHLLGIFTMADLHRTVSPRKDHAPRGISFTTLLSSKPSSSRSI